MTSQGSERPRSSGDKPGTRSREVPQRMSLGIYKQGQGYWVRVLTAAVAGVLIISAAAWGWGQAGIVRLPARQWTISLSNVQGDINPADTVVFEYYDVESGNIDTLTDMGSALVDEFQVGKGSSGNLLVSGFENELVKQRASDAVRIYAGAKGSESMTAIVRGGTPTAVFPVLYLQAGIAGIMMLAGAVVLYYFVGAQRKSVEFLVATDGEMKKVNWTSYKEVKGSTIVVIVATFLIAGFLFLVDTAFSSFFSFIDILER